MRAKRRWWRVTAGVVGALAVVATVLLVAGPFGGPTADEHFAQAKRSVDEGDLPSALVALRNVLQSEPTRGAARTLLAQTLVGLGDGAGAIKELDRAKPLGVDEPPALRLEAMLLEGRNAEVLGALAVDTGTQTSPELLVLRGRAALALGKTESARAAFAKALERAPDTSAARLGLAQLLLAGGDHEQAAQVLTLALAPAQGLPQAWLLQGNIELARGDYIAAKAAFETAGRQAHGNPTARLGIARAALLSGDVPAATQLLNALGNQFPTATPVLYWRAVAAAAAGDIERAVSLYRAILGRVPNHPESLFGLGRIQLEQRNYSDAEAVLERLSRLAPNHLPTKKLLAAAQIRLRKPEAAVQTLDPDGDGTVSADAPTLGLLATAYRMQGEPERATALLREAVQLAPKRAAFQTELALGQITAGEVDAAMASLEAAIALEPDHLQTEVLLVLVPLSAGRTDEALTTAKALAARRPNSPLVHTLLAGALLRAGKTEPARVALEQALAINPNYPDALVNLGRLELKDGEIATARSRFEQVLAARAGHPAALAELAALSLAAGDVAAAITHLENARALNERAVDARAQLASLYASVGRATDALTVAHEAVALAPQRATSLLVLARAQIGVGDADGAEAVLTDVLSREANSADAHVELAKVSILRGEFDTAQASFKQALHLSSNHFGATAELAKLAIRQSDTDAAIHWSRKLEKTYPTRPQGAALEGDSWRASGAHAKALRAYQRALTISPRSEIVLAIAGQLTALGKPDAANQRLREWLKTHPSDTRVAQRLAVTAQVRGEAKEAVERYEKLLASGGRNFSITPGRPADWLAGLRGSLCDELGQWRDVVAQGEPVEQIVPEPNPEFLAGLFEAGEGIACTAPVLGAGGAGDFAFDDVLADILLAEIVV